MFLPFIILKALLINQIMWIYVTILYVFCMLHFFSEVILCVFNTGNYVKRLGTMIFVVCHIVTFLGFNGFGETEKRSLMTTFCNDTLRFGRKLRRKKRLLNGAIQHQSSWQDFTGNDWMTKNSVKVQENSCLIVKCQGCDSCSLYNPLSNEKLLLKSFFLLKIDCLRLKHWLLHTKKDNFI